MTTLRKSKFRIIEIYRTKGFPEIALVLLDKGGRTGTQLCGAPLSGEPIGTVTVDVDRFIKALKG